MGDLVGLVIIEWFEMGGYSSLGHGLDEKAVLVMGTILRMLVSMLIIAYSNTGPDRIRMFASFLYSV